MIYAIVGPTGSGKTSLAIRLAKKLECPIINVDAFQIYKDMNIGTGKVPINSEEYKLHYLLDIVMPYETYNVKRYQTDFREVLDKLILKYKDVIICGGTGLYLKAGLYDYNFPKEEDIDTSDLDVLTNQELFKMLKSLDIKQSEVIHVNNRKRLIRAITFARNHTINKSSNIENQEHKMIYDNVKIYLVLKDREKLYNDINQRVENMFEEGLIDEVKCLLDKYDLSLTARMAIGYKEVIDYLSNTISLEDCISLIQQRSRNYAKRQITFFKHQFPVIIKDNLDDIYEEIIHG